MFPSHSAAGIPWQCGMVKTITDVQDIPTCCLCFLNEIFTPLSPAISALHRLHCKVQKVSKVSFPKGINSQYRYCPASSDRDELRNQRTQEGPLPPAGMVAKPTLQQAWVECPSSPLLRRWCYSFFSVRFSKMYWTNIHLSSGIIWMFL